MSKLLDLDDAVGDNPLAKNELAELRAKAERCDYLESLPNNKHLRAALSASKAALGEVRKILISTRANDTDPERRERARIWLGTHPADPPAPK
jgi:hypothetical protein